MLKKLLNSIDKKILNLLTDPSTLPRSQEDKIAIIKSYIKNCEINIMVETGTYLGDTTFAVKDDLSKIISIELDDNLYKKATLRFGSLSKITIVHGDSGTILPSILKHINEPVAFWLDGHYSGRQTAKGELDTPIKKELEAILNHHIKKHVILIDDARFFNGKNGYPTIKELVKYISSKTNIFDYKIQDDIIRIVLGRVNENRINYNQPIRIRIANYYRMTRDSIKEFLKYETN
jgi:hypothetical protein